MKLALESTAVTTHIGKVPVRVWEGVTEDGTPCQVYVHQIGVKSLLDAGDLDRELDQLPPAREVNLALVLAGLYPKGSDP